MRKVTGDFATAAKAADDSVVRIIYDNKDPLPQTTSNVSEENHGRSISLHSSPLETRELRPQRQKNAPNKLRKSDEDPTTVLITARIIDWETHLFSIAEDQSPLDTQLIYPSASTLMDVSSELSQ